MDERDEEGRGEAVLAALVFQTALCCRIVHDHRSSATDGTPTGRIDYQWIALDRGRWPLDPHGVALIHEFATREEENAVDAERWSRDLEHGARDLREIVSARDRERRRPRDVELDVLSSQLRRALPQRGARVLHGLRDESAHR